MQKSRQKIDNYKTKWFVEITYRLPAFRAKSSCKNSFAVFAGCVFSNRLLNRF